MEPSFAGLNHVFTSPTEICDNCGLAEQQHKLISSTSPITSMLLDYAETGQLASLRPEHVKPFLIKKLKWRVVAVCYLLPSICLYRLIALCYWILTIVE
jgi:tyrosinase